MMNTFYVNISYDFTFCHNSFAEKLLSIFHERRGSGRSHNNLFITCAQGKPRSRLIILNGARGAGNMNLDEL
jgi:hypothetical protein